jgi:hypothetical protein
MTLANCQRLRVVRTPRPLSQGPIILLRESFPQWRKTTPTALFNSAQAVRAMQPSEHDYPKPASGFHQVSFAAYATQREAYNAKAGLSERNNYPDAWVLKK